MYSTIIVSLILVSLLALVIYAKKQKRKILEEHFHMLNWYYSKWLVELDNYDETVRGVNRNIVIAKLPYYNGEDLPHYIDINEDPTGKYIYLRSRLNATLSRAYSLQHLSENRLIVIETKKALNTLKAMGTVMAKMNVEYKNLIID